ncbi:MAG: hypothetical protein WC914_00035 [Proteiniphilum sp.]
MKIYSLKTIGQEHTMPFKVGDKNVYVKFEKASPTDRVAQFSTEDEKLQDAIEESPRFKEKRIKLIFSNQKSNPSKVKAKEPGTPPVDPNDENQDPPAGPPADPNPPTEYPEVTTLKAARVILEAEFGVDPSEMNNREKVFAKAAEMGVSFPNIPPAKE